MATLQSAINQDQANFASNISKPANHNELHAQCGVPSLSLAVGRPRNSILDLDMISPVNQNGSFEFDRVIKSGVVQKRTRKTKAWKSIYLVLRPLSLSIYKNQREDKLRHKIHLSDLTAVTYLKDPKNKRQHIFGLFSPSRNYHLQAQSKADVKEWVDLIRKESRVEEEEEIYLGSPTFCNPGSNLYGSSSHENTTRKKTENREFNDENPSSSSLETADPTDQTRRSECIDAQDPRKPSYTVEYSGNEIASHSDWSDVEQTKVKVSHNVSAPEKSTAPIPPRSSASYATRNLDQKSGYHAEQELERVVWQGYLLWLRSRRGVRHWKNMWVVIRCKSITCYKDESEYLPSTIIPLSSVMNAVEIDPISKTKKLCLQIITDEKSFKFCAQNEDSLDKSLGAIKSLIAQRRETRILR
ncbi:putative ph domain-containing protein [Erysiphe neolycopersici]|uniref:Putative ph domain-containing protein n=1 Tax=Erysiphe neolycopersici TaxID=212602 RepID=A0A420I7I4_9PEZI|nr:putative ph domain-containing protein [Erysiphe neolycopersici]